MGEIYFDLLKAFGFKEMQMWIVTMSTLLFSTSLLGGILSALMFVNSSALHQRPLKERISFRLFMLSEVVLVVFIFFYHAFMIERMSISHIVYWISAMMIMPLLAIIGSQAIQVVFSGRIKAKEAVLKRQDHAARAKHAAGTEPADGKTGHTSSKPGHAGGKPGHTTGRH